MMMELSEIGVYMGDMKGENVLIKYYLLILFYYLNKKYELQGNEMKYHLKLTGGRICRKISCKHFLQK